MTHRLARLVSIAVLLAPAVAAAQFPATHYYHIKPRHALQAGYNLCLDVDNVSPWDGARVQQYTCNTAWPQENQLWSLVPVTASTYRLVPAISAKCLDVVNPQNGSGAPMQQVTCNLQVPESKQVFNVTPAGTAGYYRITSTYSGGSQCLDVPYSSLAAGQDVQQWACGPWWQDNQDWQIVPTWTRTPKGHIQYFGYYGEGTAFPPSAASDHVNMITYTPESLPLIANAAPHVKAKLALVDMIVYKPMNGDLYANTFDGNGNPTDGGLRASICDHWAQKRSQIAAYMPRVGAFYVDEPIWNLRLKGWTDADALTLVSIVAGVVKGTACPSSYPADPAIPFAVVEAYPTAGIQQPSAVDWVGFDCYEALDDCNGPGDNDTPNFMQLWNTQKALLLPHQRLVMVPSAKVTRHTVPYPYDPIEAVIGTTPQEQQAEAARADFFVALAQSEPKAVAVWPWHATSRYAQYVDELGNPVYGPAHVMLWIGAFDMPTVKSKWQFLTRALGFGAP